MVQHLSPTNEFGAFCSGAKIELLGSSAGPLRGLKSAAKDNFDVEGFVTGAGSPDWKEMHAPAPFTAQSIRLLLSRRVACWERRKWTSSRGARWVQMNIMRHRGIPRRRVDFLAVPPVVRHVL